MTEPKQKPRLLGPPASGKVCSLAELAKYLGREQNTVQRWAKEEGMPVAYPSPGPGRPHEVDTAECVHWLVQRFSEGANARAEFDRHRARKMDADADVAELELREKRGELVRVDSVRRQWSHMLGVLRNAFMAMPNRVAATLESCETHEDRYRLLREAVREVLEELADYGQTAKSRETPPAA